MTLGIEDDFEQGWGARVEVAKIKEWESVFGVDCCGNVRSSSLFECSAKPGLRELN
jgi:hypothetical protein